MNKIVIGIVLGLIIIGCAFVGNVSNKEEEEVGANKMFQGPVRPTDDLKHFRSTGETISREIDG